MNYIHILDRLINTPLLISQEKLELINNKVTLKLLAEESIDRSQSTPSNTHQYLNTTNNYAIISVYGSLVNKNGAGSSGITSYEGIKQDINSAIKAGITNLIINVSSCGGEAAGCFPLTDYIASLPTKGINTFGFTDSIAHSGGYAILASCKKVFATDIASVGSIGALCTLIDVTKMDVADGISYQVIRSRANKASYNPHEGISQDVIDKMTKKVMEIDTKFTNSVINYRNGSLKLETIDKLAGDVVSAIEAKQLGLIDEVVVGIEDIFDIINGKN